MTKTETKTIIEDILVKEKATYKITTDEVMAIVEFIKNKFGIDFTKTSVIEIEPTTITTITPIGILKPLPESDYNYFKEFVNNWNKNFKTL